MLKKILVKNSQIFLVVTCFLIGTTCVKAQCSAWTFEFNNVHLSKYLSTYPNNCNNSYNNILRCYWLTPQDACKAAVKEREWEGPQGVKFTFLEPTKVNDSHYKCNYKRSDLTSPSLGEIDTEKENVAQQPSEPFCTVSGPYRQCSDIGSVQPGGSFDKRQKEKIMEMNEKSNGGKSDLAGKTIAGYTEPSTPLDDYFPSDNSREIYQFIPPKDRQTCNCGTNSYKNAIVISNKLKKILANKPPPPELLEAVKKIKPYPCSN